MFVQKCWYVAAWSHEVEAGAIVPVEIAGERLLIYRQDGGSIVALEDRCCHRSAPLSKGRIEDGCNIRCMYHGLKFSAEGICIEIPGQDKIPPAARIRRFAAVERHSWIWIWMSDPAEADEALIPPAIGFDDPRYIFKWGQIDYQANYQLLNDNLTDLSHVSYVHANSFGATDLVARTRPKVRRIERGVRVSRWMASVAEGMNDGAILLRDEQATGTPTAMYQTYDYLAPGIFLCYTGIYRAADMPGDGESTPTAEPLSANFTNQAVTPMTEHTTRYFFSWGPRAIDGGEELAEEMLKLAYMAFAEDRDMIEAQQRVIDREERENVLTSADVGPVQMRAVISQLIKAEHSAQA